MWTCRLSRYFFAHPLLLHKDGRLKDRINSICPSCHHSWVHGLSIHALALCVTSQFKETGKVRNKRKHNFFFICQYNQGFKIRERHTFTCPLPVFFSLVDLWTSVIPWLCVIGNALPFPLMLRTLSNQRKNPEYSVYMPSKTMQRIK